MARKMLAQIHNSETVDIWGTLPGTVAISSTGADADDLPEGIYDVHTDTDCYVKIHATDASDVLTTTGYLLLAGTVVSFLVRNTHHLGAVTASASGTLRYQKVG